MSKVHVYTIAYNEEVMLPQFIKYYRERFPNCKITVFDNESTDKTFDIAKENNCQIIVWPSNNTIRDDMYLHIKNNCWRNSEAEWVIVVDCDEFVDISEESLKNPDFNIIKAEGFDMMGNSLDIEQIDSGVRSPGYDKICVFKKDTIEEINYFPGAHNADIVAKEELVFNEEPIKLFHFKWLTYDYVIERYKLFANRLSDINKKNGWGIHYTFDENVQKEYYQNGLQNKIKVR
jgi:hypothetical protein